MMQDGDFRTLCAKKVEIDHVFGSSLPARSQVALARRMQEDA